MSDHAGVALFVPAALVSGGRCFVLPLIGA
jgi:hypothetical protein